MMQKAINSFYLKAAYICVNHLQIEFSKTALPDYVQSIRIEILLAIYVATACNPALHF